MLVLFITRRCGFLIRRKRNELRSVCVCAAIFSVTFVFLLFFFTCVRFFFFFAFLLAFQTHNLFISPLFYFFIFIAIHAIHAASARDPRLECNRHQNKKERKRKDAIIKRIIIIIINNNFDYY